MPSGVSSRVAIAHEWVAARAGSEKVFQELARAFPEADLYAMTVTPGVALDTGGRTIQTTLLDRLGRFRDRRGALLPLMPLAWRNAGRGESYDTVITSSHACVKGFRPARDARHLCYVHAPMRYAWNPEIDSRGAGRWAAPARSLLRRWDRRSADWVDSFAANSTAVAERIRDFYGRDATVIHPPVDTAYFAGAQDRDREGLVTLGRLIPYKGHDVAIRVAAHIGVPIKVVGSGPEESRLRALAQEVRADAEFIVGANDAAVRDTVASAKALVFAAIEDFGIVPVEAQAAGTPVVGPREGGLRDTVVDGVTGVFSADLSVEGVAEACQTVLTGDLDATSCRVNAERFSVDQFRRRVREWHASATTGIC